MSVEQISTSGFLSQLDRMNQHLQAMGQGARGFNTTVNNNLGLNVAQADYFSGESAARALRADALSMSQNAQQAAAAIGQDNAAAATHLSPVPPESAGQTVGEFKQLLTDAFENVNFLQNKAGELSSRFDVGDRSITLSDVMIASQKSSLSFEATLQIRNRIVEAYQSIMQMQI